VLLVLPDRLTCPKSCFSAATQTTVTQSTLSAPVFGCVVCEGGACFLRAIEPVVSRERSTKVFQVIFDTLDFILAEFIISELSSLHSAQDAIKTFEWAINKIISSEWCIESEYYIESLKESCCKVLSVNKKRRDFSSSLHLFLRTRLEINHVVIYSAIIRCTYYST
jgi:hypothetical protein